MTILDRAEAYRATFPQWPASWLQPVTEQGATVLYGRWLLGNNYRRKVGYYGEYPPSYLTRVMALFPDATGGPHVLHVFSGSLPAGDYERCDSHQPAELQCSVYSLPSVILNWRPRLIIADPPYSTEDAKRYGTPMIDRRRALACLAQITDADAHLCWLDTCWPMHRKQDWRTVARIAITRSTNHRVRDLTIFERVA